jgi:hypothetical protein
MRLDLPMNNTLWALLAYLVSLEAETRVIRYEHRGAVNAFDGAGLLTVGNGNGNASKRWCMCTNLKNLISHREEFEPFEYLCRVSHIDPW